MNIVITVEVPEGLNAETVASYLDNMILAPVVDFDYTVEVDNA